MAESVRWTFVLLGMILELSQCSNCKIIFCMKIKLPFPHRNGKLFNDYTAKLIAWWQGTDKLAPAFWCVTVCFMKWTRSYFWSTVLVNQSLNYVRNRARLNKNKVNKSDRNLIAPGRFIRKRNGAELWNIARRSPRKISSFPGKFTCCICLCMSQSKLNASRKCAVDHLYSSKYAVTDDTGKVLYYDPYLFAWHSYVTQNIPPEKRNTRLKASSSSTKKMAKWRLRDSSQRIPRFRGRIKSFQVPLFFKYLTIRHPVIFGKAAELSSVSIELKESWWPRPTGASSFCTYFVWHTTKIRPKPCMIFIILQYFTIDMITLPFLLELYSCRILHFIPVILLQIFNFHLAVFYF